VPHLATFRKGCENERLTAYLLSRFSFVAQPTSSTDDLGSDFFCTIFEINEASRKDALLPRISFAVQVKRSVGRSLTTFIALIRGVILTLSLSLLGWTQEPPLTSSTQPNGIVVFAYRAKGHVRFGKQEEFTRIVDDLLSFLKSNRIAVLNDSLHSPVETTQAKPSESFIAGLRGTGVQHVLQLVVDVPFSARLKLILTCYEMTGKIAWEEPLVEKGQLRQSAAEAQGKEELHSRLEARIQDLNGNNSLPPTTTPPPAPVIVSKEPVPNAPVPNPPPQSPIITQNTEQSPQSEVVFGPALIGYPYVVLGSTSTGTNWNAYRNQTAEMAMDFQKDCPQVRVTTLSGKAYYAVNLNHIEHDWNRDNQIMVTNAQGDVLLVREKGSIRSSVKAACEVIVKDWNSKVK
jgi:hypothetical protein